MSKQTYAEVARDLTPREIEARQKVWQAFLAGEAVELSAAECGALWTSILQTGRELSWYRGQLPVATVRPSQPTERFDRSDVCECGAPYDRDKGGYACAF